MTRDYTQQKYQQLLQNIQQAQYKTQTIQQHLTTPKPNTIILRHDVDRKPQQALQIAQIEHKYNIQSTYYFRTTRETLQPGLIKQIATMGHEIGYHYEVMDKAKGDPKQAIKIFEEELNTLREITPIHTICMHGNPLKPWSNKDLWQQHDYTKYNIIGEPYLSIDYTQVTYFTDTGRSWNNSKYSIKDKTSQNQVQIKNTDQLIQLIKNKTYPQICILTHPNRWSNTTRQWLTELTTQNIKNIAKMGINIYRGAK